MRRIITLILIAALFSGCSSVQHLGKLTSNSLDYTSYTKKGFFITEASSVSFEYSPISSVSSINTSGHWKLENGNKAPVVRSVEKYSDDTYGLNAKMGVRSKYKYLKASETVVLEELYKQAVQAGADGIINLKITYFNFNEEGYQATGMAIKRK